MRGLAGTQACINFCCGYSVFLDAHLRMIINAGTLAEHPDLPAGADITRHRARDAGQPAGGAGTQGPRGPLPPRRPTCAPAPSTIHPSTDRPPVLPNRRFGNRRVTSKRGHQNRPWQRCPRRVALGLVSPVTSTALLNHPPRGCAPPLLPPAIPLSGTGQLLVLSSWGSGSASAGRHVGNGFTWH